MPKTDKEIKDNFKASAHEFHDMMRGKIKAKKDDDKAKGKPENETAGKADAMLDVLKALLQQL